jgi:hypothetical protein
MRRSNCDVRGRWKLREQKKYVIVSSTIRSNMLFTLRQTLMGVSKEEWGGSDKYSKLGSEKCVQNV